ncbi:MAG: regulatory protein RecX [Lachnospiraceae bacterium]|nr:regulatory protein RecX [Lachnospiraceae bacterium]MDD3615145.1 regulatory protein RecX [Lachnospiraceae bacterium]
MAEDEIKKAKRKAMQILTRMDRSEYDLSNSLRRSKFSEEAVLAAVEYVKSYGYIDDARYARMYIRTHQHQRGRIRLQYELGNKGVSADLVAQAYEELELAEEKEVVRSLVKKKWNKPEKPNEKELARIVGYLARQGFKNQDIWCILHEENLT